MGGPQPALALVPMLIQTLALALVPVLKMTRGGRPQWTSPPAPPGGTNTRPAGVGTSLSPARERSERSPLSRGTPRRQGLVARAFHHFAL